MNLTFQTQPGKQNVYVTLQDSRIAIISGPPDIVKEEKLIPGGNSFLKKVSYTDQVIFMVGGKLTFFLDAVKSTFVIREIIKNDIPGRYYITCSKRNWTTIFLLPLLSLSPTENRTFWGWKSFLINAYLTDTLDELLLITRFFPSIEYRDFEEKLKSHANYLGFIDPNYYSVGYRFRIDLACRNDIHTFLKGNYSKLSNTLKKKICSFHGCRKHSDLYKILYRDSSRAEQLASDLGLSKEELGNDIDLLSIPNPVDEFYSLSHDNN